MTSNFDFQIKPKASKKKMTVVENFTNFVPYVFFSRFFNPGLFIQNVSFKSISSV